MLPTDPSGHETEAPRLAARRETASGGKEYWAKLVALGLYETEDGLRLCRVLFSSLSPNVTLQI
jgi:hypothetical protein